MDKKKKRYFFGTSVLTIVFLFSTIFILSAHTFGIDGSITHNVHADTPCDHAGFHYPPLTATSSSTGLVEHWACCRCHEVFTSNPGGTRWVDGTSVSPMLSDDYNDYVKTYYVNLNSGSATTSGTASVQAQYGASMPAITKPTKLGYTFNGYFANSDGTGTMYYDGNGASAATWNIKTNNISLYAKWTITDYTVTLDQQSGSGGTTSFITHYGDALPTSINIPTRIGYTFGGYFTGTDGSGTQYYDNGGRTSRTYNTYGNTILYAYWLDTIVLNSTNYPTSSASYITSETTVSAGMTTPLIYNNFKYASSNHVSLANGGYIRTNNPPTSGYLKGGASVNIVHNGNSSAVRFYYGVEEYNERYIEVTSNTTEENIFFNSFMIYATTDVTITSITITYTNPRRTLINPYWGDTVFDTTNAWSDIPSTSATKKDNEMMRMDMPLTPGYSPDGTKILLQDQYYSLRVKIIAPPSVWMRTGDGTGLYQSETTGEKWGGNFSSKSEFDYEWNAIGLAHMLRDDGHYMHFAAFSAGFNSANKFCHGTFENGKHLYEGATVPIYESTKFTQIWGGGDIDSCDYFATHRGYFYMTICRYGNRFIAYYDNTKYEDIDSSNDAYPTYLTDRDSVPALFVNGVRGTFTNFQVRVGRDNVQHFMYEQHGLVLS